MGRVSAVLVQMWAGYTMVVGRLQRLGRVGRPSPSVQRLLERRFPLCVAMALARRGDGTGPAWHWHWPGVALARRGNGTGPAWQWHWSARSHAPQHSSRHAAERPGSDGRSTATPTRAGWGWGWVGTHKVARLEHGCAVDRPVTVHGPFVGAVVTAQIVVMIPTFPFKVPTMVATVLIIIDRPGYPSSPCVA